jgi:ketosteroid isomerase-like protein
MIVLWDGRGIALDGKPYENTYVFLMQMRDGFCFAGSRSCRRGRQWSRRWR